MEKKGIEPSSKRQCKSPLRVFTSPILKWKQWSLSFAVWVELSQSDPFMVSGSLEFVELLSSDDSMVCILSCGDNLMARVNLKLLKT